MIATLLLTTLSGQVYREKKISTSSWATCAMLWQTDVCFLFNIVQSDMMSDTGFTCPKCDHTFPTAEQVAEHLRNEHIDGTQTESTKRMT